MKYWRRFWRRKPKIDLTNIVLLLLIITFIRTFLLELTIIWALALIIWIGWSLRRRYLLRWLDPKGKDELKRLQTKRPA